MVNIETVIIIDKRVTVALALSGWAALQQWELDNAISETSRRAVLRKIANFNKKSSILEERFKYPSGSLSGIHLIMGNAQGLIKSLNKPDIRNLLLDPKNVFIVKIRQNDLLIKTSIHTPIKVIKWEHVNDDFELISWPQGRAHNET